MLWPEATLWKWLQSTDKARKTVNSGYTESVSPFTNTQDSLQELNFDWGVFMATICYSDPN